MGDWTIKIATSDGKTTFVADLSGAKPGQPLNAQQDDLVTWNNTTNDEHQPWQTNSNYTPVANSNLSDPIPAGQSSNTYDCASPNQKPPAPQTWTVYYFCKTHPDNTSERGTIIVSAVATSGVNIMKSGSGATFSPQVRAASQDDLISWNNATKDMHQPWPTDANYQPLQVSKGSPQYLADEIPPGEASLTYRVAQPAGNPTTWTVYYYCKLHPNDTDERGTIFVPTPS